MEKIVIKKLFICGMILLFFGVNYSAVVSLSAHPNERGTCTSVQLIINNDGWGDPTDMSVDVPPYVQDSGITPTIPINFTITGVSGNGTAAFYGDDPWEDWKNITVSGDILYPVTNVSLYHVGTQGEWNCFVTPTQPYGVIALSIDWPGNGSANETIQITNGTWIIPQVESFPWGRDFNLTVTVTDIDGAPVKNAHLYVIWEEDDNQFNQTIGNNKIGNGANGEYTFWITRQDQGEFPPKNVTLVALWYTGYWGYTKVSMERPSHPPIVYVDDDYNSSTPGWGYNHFNTIQEGINAVENNGTVFVYNGTYSENIIVNKSLKLLGESKDSTLLDGSGGGEGANITAQNVTIRGFTVQNYAEGNGISISTANNQISDNIISDNWGGIATYDGNPFEQNSSTLRYNTIANNQIIRNDYGIGLSGHNNTIVGNRVAHSQYGIIVVVADFCNITQNNISDNENGILIIASYYTMMYRNTISQNEKLGVSDFCTSSTTVAQNNFVGNGQNAYFNQPFVTRFQIFKNFFDFPIHRSVWDENYWDKPRIIPYMIPGLISFIRGPIIEAPYIFDFFQIDCHPANTPYDIPGGG
jgi:parallel beta-helix repeat protein